jgi:tetratricopeptide (TPR) repeat protein
MLRVIGSALLGVDETEAAIDYCLRSIKKSGEGTENAFYAHWIIANAYHRQDIFEQAMEHHQFALKTLPPSWKEHPENLKDAEGVAWILDQLASCHQHNNQPDLAIQTYNESKRIDPDKSPFSIGYTLERIVNVRQWDEITDEYFDMLKSWTKEERNAWLEYQSTWMWYGEFENLIRLAKLSGPPNIDFVIRCLEDYISTKKRGNTRTIAPLMGLERLYDLVMDDKVTALQTCSRILEDMGDADVDLEWILVIVRSWKARLLFNHFRTSSDVSIKKDLLVQMITLSTFQIGNATDDDIRQGRLNITLAMMKRSLGYKLEFQELVEECFRSCKRTLSDTIGSNDSSSLRLLSRLLACLPGLEWDAQVAMTCQLYITDPNVKHDFDSDDDSSLSEQSHSANIDPQDQSTTSYQADDIKSTTENLDHSLGTSSQSGVLGTMPNVATETTLSGLESVDSNTIRDHSSNDREHEDLRQDPVTKTGSPERQSSNPTTVSEAESARQKLVYPLEADEGLRPEGQRGAYCDGKCGRTLKTWAEPWYICVHCDDTDLCTSCLNTRRAMNRGEPCPSWEPWCGQNHAYIRGPVQGWRGIRAGVMRIIKDVDYGIAEVTAVEAIEDIPFKQWLEDLEMIKLPRAWKRFWEGEDFLKDIGM